VYFNVFQTVKRTCSQLRVETKGFSHVLCCIQLAIKMKDALAKLMFIVLGGHTRSF
jgi:hypothetical protein